MEWLSLVALLLVLVLVARGTPGRWLLVVAAVTLAVVVLVLFAERSGLWLEGMRQ